MHKITVVAIAASLFGAPISDARAGSNTSGVFGFLNSNGTFRPMLAEKPAPKAAAAATIITGTLVVNFTFTHPRLRYSADSKCLCLALIRRG